MVLQCLENNNYNSDIEYAWGYPNDRKKIINEEVIKKACFIKMPNLDCRVISNLQCFFILDQI